MLRLAALVWLAAPAPAADWFVAPGGNDANPGTATAPFRTVQKGVDAAAAPGDAVLLAGGVYETRDAIRLRRSGAPGRPIRVAALPGEKPVVRFLEPRSGRYPRLEIEAEGGVRAPIGWLVVEGLELAGGYDGIKFRNAHDLVIRGVTVRGSLWQGILGVSGTSVTIAGCVLLGNGDPSAAPGDRSIVNKLHGLYATGTRYEIVDNVFDGNLSWGLQAAGYPYDASAHAGPEYAGASDWRVARNVFARQVHHGGIVVWLPGARGLSIEDNVFEDNASKGAPGAAHGIDFLRSGGGHRLARNVFRRAGPDERPAIADSRGGASYAEAP